MVPRPASNIAGDLVGRSFACSGPNQLSTTSELAGVPGLDSPFYSFRYVNAVHHGADDLDNGPRSSHLGRRYRD